MYGIRQSTHAVTSIRLRTVRGPSSTVRAPASAYARWSVLISNSHLSTHQLLHTLQYSVSLQSRLWTFRPHSGLRLSGRGNPVSPYGRPRTVACVATYCTRCGLRDGERCACRMHAHHAGTQRPSCSHTQTSGSSATSASARASVESGQCTVLSGNRFVFLTSISCLLFARYNFE